MLICYVCLVFLGDWIAYKVVAVSESIYEIRNYEVAVLGEAEFHSIHHRGWMRFLKLKYRLVYSHDANEQLCTTWLTCVTYP